MTLGGRQVLIRADGSHAIGLGHIYRMKSLADTLKAEGSNVAFLSLEDEAANQLIRAAGHPCFTFFSPDAYLPARQILLAQHRPDLLLYDTLDVPQHEFETLPAHSGVKVVTFDDTAGGLIHADLVINGIVFHWGHYDSAQARSLLLEGPDYMILQPELARYLQPSRETPYQAHRILLAFGGSDTRGLTERALGALNQLARPLDITISLGPGSRLTPGLEVVMETSRHQLTLVRGLPSLFAAFKAHDLVVCAGGVMLYELAALGIPSAAIASEAHEIRNIAYWSERGTTLPLGSGETWDPLAAATSLAALLDDQRRRNRMAFAGRHHVDGQGLKRVMGALRTVIA